MAWITGNLVEVGGSKQPSLEIRALQPHFMPERAPSRSIRVSINEKSFVRGKSVLQTLVENEFKLAEDVLPKTADEFSKVNDASRGLLVQAIKAGSSQS